MSKDSAFIYNSTKLISIFTPLDLYELNDNNLYLTNSFINLTLVLLQNTLTSRTIIEKHIKLLAE